MPIDLADMVSRLNAESYSGEERDGYSDGEGVYQFSNGIVYTGKLYEGMFDGDGTLAFAQGGKFIAKWDKGKLMYGTYYFDDNLQYFTSDWTYSTDADRRFWTGIQNGIILADEPQLTDKNPPMWIPVGTHDVGDGYYDPLDNTLYKYNGNAKDQRPTEAEAAWAVRKCRIGVAEVDDDEEEEEVSEVQFEEESEDYESEESDEGDEEYETEDDEEEEEEEEELPPPPESDRTITRKLVHVVIEEAISEPTPLTTTSEGYVAQMIEEVFSELDGIHTTRSEVVSGLVEGVIDDALTTHAADTMIDETSTQLATSLVDGVLDELDLSPRPETSGERPETSASTMDRLASALVDEVLEKSI